MVTICANAAGSNGAGDLSKYSEVRGQVLIDGKPVGDFFNYCFRGAWEPYQFRTNVTCGRGVHTISVKCWVGYGTNANACITTAAGRASNSTSSTRVSNNNKTDGGGMAWRSWVFETMTGVIHAPIDLPKFAWSVDVSDSSLATLKDKGVGDLDLSGCDGPVGVGAGRHDAGQTPHPHPRPVQHPPDLGVRA